MPKMLIIVSEGGRVVGAAHLGRDDGPGPHVAIRPLAGQKVVEVDVPAEIARLTSGHSFHLALSHADFDAATNKLRFKRTTKKLLHS